MRRCRSPSASRSTIRRTSASISSARACSIVQVDCARIGGITPWLKVAHLAEAFNVAVCPHFLMELHVSLTAAVPNGAWVEYIPQLDDDHDVAHGDGRRLTRSRPKRRDSASTGTSARSSGSPSRARHRALIGRKSRCLPEAHSPSACTPNDDVVIARAQLVGGTQLLDEKVTVSGLVPPGHKVATRAIAKGAPVKRYNQIIGFASRDIAPGEHVHLNNLAMGVVRSRLRVRRGCASPRNTSRPRRRSTASSAGRPERRPRRHAQLHRHPVDGQLLGDGRARHRRSLHARAPRRRFRTSTAWSR